MLHTTVALARLSARTHGIVGRAQAMSAGLTHDFLDHAVAQGVLVPLHAGVYLHRAAPFTRTSRLLAACMACGPHAVASHRSAAWLHDLRDVPRSRPEVTVPGTRLPLHERVIRHRTNLLEPVDVTHVEGVPVTTVARTLLDLGAVVHPRVVEQATHDAVIQGKATKADLICVLERAGRRGRRGTAALREAVVSELPPDGLQTKLEAGLRGIVAGTGVPDPVWQHPVRLPCGRDVRLDLAWPEALVAVEADGRRWHSTRADFERDLARSNALTAAGWSHYRYGWNDVFQFPERTSREITANVGARL